METILPRCPIINTARLKPFRQRLNRIIMTITDSGCVSMEVMTHLTAQTDSPEIAKELFHISPDGTQIEVYQSAEGVSAIDGCPVSCQPYKVYTYPNLPDKQWRKYHHCYKFIQVVKSRTPKIVLITEHARCKLMENFPHPDFQACFTDGVTVHLTETKITVTDALGSSLSFDSTSVNCHVNASTMERVEFAKKCKVQCLEIQDSVSRLKSHEQNSDLFPIVVGTSSSPFKLSAPMYNNENAVNQNGSRPSLEPPVTNLPPFTQQSLPLTHSLTDSKPLNSKNYLSQSNSFSQENCVDCHFNVENQAPKQGGNQYLSYEIQSRQCHESDSISFSALDFKDIQQVKDSRCDCMIQGLSESVTPQTPQKSQDFVFSTENKCFCQNTTTTAHSLERCPQTFGMSSQEDTLLNLPPFFNASCSISQSSGNHQVESYQILGGNHPADCHVDGQVQTPGAPGSTHGHTACMNQQEHIYQTPKKSSNVMPYHPQCYSVDSMKHRHYLKDENRYSLTLGALVDETELRNVRKNLFSDLTLEEPLVKPMPFSDPESLRKDLLSLQRTPSLELSFCNETDVPQSTDNNLGQASRLDVLTLLQHSQNMPSCSTSAQVAQVVHATHSNEESDFNFEQTLSYVKESCNNLQTYRDHKNVKDNNPLMDENKVRQSAAVIAGKESAIEKQALPIPNICSSPVKSVSLQKRSCPSPLNSPLKMGGATGSQNCSAGIMTGHLTCNMPLEMSLCQSCSANSNNSPLSSASWNGSCQSIQSHEHSYKSDPRNYEKTNLGVNYLQSPHKEVIMFASNEMDRNAFRINRHPHLRNSLDMSASSYYSDSHSSSPSSGCDPIRQVFVPYSGWASFYASGSVWILYNDGTQLGVKSTEATIIYVDQDGTQKRYRNSDVIPEIIKMKLEKLPKIIEMLVKSPPITTGTGMQS
ncbi:unnamed protein product [Lymnaea stagnalis]|uniref:Uncharacterized protein n=1 Tax=Lymnaea stagnalis TaxID=6523 RepID=A0AAV2HCD3_LYMST